jgi:hypothetical protein
MATRVTFLSGRDTLVTENEAEVAAAVRDHPARSSSRAPTACCSPSTRAALETLAERPTSWPRR